MTDTNRIEDWRVLCELASKEKDPEKLIEVIMKINRALEECHQRLYYYVDANASSNSIPISAVTEFHRHAVNS